ncbi:acyl carrier protein [Aquipuribacter hungaricus]|uniref:Acyl carrier protein n=1 Tax=Aquipuribacter hungaricus TaxID=545624 RepID=A0ABV7WIH5_9MICO
MTGQAAEQEPGAVRTVVLDELRGTLADDGKPVPELDDDSVLLDTGLDSLGFAVLVTRLEDSLGYDPFTDLEDAVYPRTVGEFVAVYER